MDGQTDTQTENQTSNEEISSWAEAFAAFDRAQQANQETTGTGSDYDTVDSDGNTDSANDESGNIGEHEGSTGGSDTDTGEDLGENDDSGADLFDITEEEVEEFRTQLTESIRNRAVDDMAQEFIKRGIRNTNGKLGATINDADICKRDEDGVPRFYNPETGHEFTGDNPRRQAQEWVEDYNKELAAAFNQACENYSARLMEDEQPQIAVMEFASTYSSLDPIRQQMLDAVIEDYEITNDAGNVVGYSCDLDTALAAVNRQVSVIQEWGKANSAKQEEEEVKPSGPALDMKNSAGAVGKQGDRPNFNSIEEAMEWQQDQLLAKMREGK